MKPTQHGGSRKGAGRPAGEATKQVKVYAVDAARLVARFPGKTAAEAVRALITRDCRLDHESA